jgi:hypothetical protein
MVSKDSSVFKSVKEAPPEVRAKAVKLFEEQERKERERIARFGQIRPQISMKAHGQRWVAVRNRLYYSDKWKFFPDFLRDYLPQVFGLEWCKTEAVKPEAERHPVITWRALGAAHMNSQPAQPDGTRAALPSGALAAYMHFAYDLYVVDDNGGLDAALLERLKNPEQFQGARQELFAEATCYRAGFTIQHENEKDISTRHAEFTARHTATGQFLSVEAKSRHRDGVLGRPGQVAERPSFTFARLINDAVAKKPNHPLVVFLDTNMPYKWAERMLTRQADNALSQPMKRLLTEINKEHGGADPYTMLVLINHPHHYAIRDLAPQPHMLSVLAQHPKANISALRSLALAASLYGNIPMGFSTDEPPPPVVPARWPKIRYDFHVAGSKITVLREGQAMSQMFENADKDRPQVPSRLHEFLEDIGFSRVDAHMICKALEEGNPVQDVYGNK